MRIFFVMAAAFILNTFVCQKPYEEVSKIYRSIILIDQIETDLNKILNLNPISNRGTHTSPSINQIIGMPLLELPPLELRQFQISTTDLPQKRIKPVVKFNSEDLSKAYKLLAEIDRKINNPQEMNYEEFSNLLKTNLSTPNSNKFKPYSKQTLILTKDENGFFKLGQ